MTAGLRASLALMAALALGACAGPEAPPAGGTDAGPAPAAAVEPASPPADESGARPAIDAANEETARLVAAGDGAAVGRQYTADGELLPAHSGPVRGPEAIGRLFQASIDGGLRSLTLTADQVESRGDTAIEYGRYAAAGADGGLLDRGKYVVVWRRGAQGWRRRADISTTNLPAAVAPAPAPAS